MSRPGRTRSALVTAAKLGLAAAIFWWLLSSGRLDPEKLGAAFEAHGALAYAIGALGLVVAIFCAWGKTGGPGWLRFLINAYIEVIRNTPFLVQLFFFFFALPSIGLRWSPYTAALTGAGTAGLMLSLLGLRRLPDGALIARVGAPMPPASALDERGRPFELASLRGQRVLFKFFRGSW